MKRTLSDGWRHTFDTRVLVENNTFEARLLLWDGAVETWTRTNLTAPFRPRHREYRGELAFDLFSGEVYWTNANRAVYRFHSLYGDANLAGRLREIRDFYGNTVQVQWNSAQRWVASVVDTAGGVWQFNYDEARSRLTNVTFGQWQAGFAYDSTTNRLIATWFTNTSGLYTNVATTWQFAYNATNGLLDRITDPRGNLTVSVGYDKYGRKIEQRDALGRLTRTEYNLPAKRQIRQTDPENAQWIETYDRKGRVLVQRDPLGHETRHAYDDFGNRIRLTDANTNTTLFAYDSRANVIAITNALGEITRWQFHPFFNKAVQQITPQPADANGWITWTNFYEFDDATGNLLRHYNALGTLASYTYSTNGLLLTSTDANGNTSQFAYDTNGFLIARTDPATNVTRVAVNELGWNRAVTNALGQVTTFAHDLNGNVVRTLDPLNRVFTRTYDPNGNLLTASDAKAQLTRHTYDAADQLIQTVDRAGATNRFAYTLRGKLQFATNALGHTTTNFYDAANRLVRVANPLGHTVTNLYDPAGNLVAAINPLGQRWTKTYDPLNRVIAETDPLGNTRQTTYDVAGRVHQIITPNGHPSTHAYDSRSRLTKWTDAEGHAWLYAYDGNANITNITDALGGLYVMAYGPRNERLLERNQDGFEWRYAYDALLRLRQQTDPNGTVRILDYDEGGRVRRARFSTGRINTFAYDANDNLRQVDRLDLESAVTTTFTHDAMDRVLTCSDDLTAREVAYSYDALGRRATLTYPEGKVLTYTYDPADRLTAQVFQFAAGQAFTNTYAYDPASRLIRRAYPNGVVQTNSFDTASRLTGLSHSALNPQPSTLNLALTYAYDRNGNKIASTETGTLDWPMPALTDEPARYTASGRLLDRAISPLDVLNPQSSTLNYAYDPSGNLTNATKTIGGTNAESWALAYDEDNRTTSIRWQTNLASTLIVNRYDALGRRIAKTVDGVQTAYVLDLATGMERILCDLNAGGGIAAWYVHGPDLCYRVDAAGNVTCYHADAQANIIALTGPGGTNLAQYAYTAYGRLLASTNAQPLTLTSQPFRFVGSQGVMEELPGLYFMRARYYSAEAGVFLSTDPVKNIGPGWKPVAYGYSGANPTRYIDPAGELWGEWAAAYDLLDALYVLAVHQDVEGAAERLGTAIVLSAVALEPTVGSATVSAYTGASISLDATTGFAMGAGSMSGRDFYGNRRDHSLAGDISFLLGMAARAVSEKFQDFAEKQNMLQTHSASQKIYQLAGTAPQKTDVGPNITTSTSSGRTVDAYNNAVLANLLISSSSAARQVMMQALQNDPVTPASRNNSSGSGGGGGGGGGGGSHTDRYGRTVHTDGAGSQYYAKPGGRRDYETASWMNRIKR